MLCRAIGALCASMLLSTVSFAAVHSTVYISQSSATVTTTTSQPINDLSMDKFLQRMQESIESSNLFSKVRVFATKDDLVSGTPTYRTTTKYRHILVSFKDYQSLPPLLLKLEAIQTDTISTIPTTPSIPETPSLPVGLMGEGEDLQSEVTSSYYTITLSGPIASYGMASPHATPDSLLNGKQNFTWSFSKGSTYLSASFNIQSLAFEQAVKKLAKSYFADSKAVASMTQHHILLGVSRLLKSVNEGIVQ